MALNLSPRVLFVLVSWVIAGCNSCGYEPVVRDGPDTGHLEYLAGSWTGRLPLEREILLGDDSTFRECVSIDSLYTFDRKKHTDCAEGRFSVFRDSIRFLPQACSLNQVPMPCDTLYGRNPSHSENYLHTVRYQDQPMRIDVEVFRICEEYRSDHWTHDDICVRQGRRTGELEMTIWLKAVSTYGEARAFRRRVDPDSLLAAAR